MPFWLDKKKNEIYRKRIETSWSKKGLHLLNILLQSEHNEMKMEVVWDQTRAAALYRFWQIENLLERIWIEINDRGVLTKVRAFMLDKTNRCYIPFAEVMKDKALQKKQFTQALAEFEWLTEKYAHLDELAPLIVAFRAVKINLKRGKG